MNHNSHLIIEGIVALLLIGRGVMSHFEHKKTEKAVNEIKIYFNGDLEKRISEERKKWEEETKNKSI